MKKFISIALTTAFVASMAAVASAGEIKLSGDARWRGLWTINKDFDSGNGNTQDNRLMDERVRLVVSGKNDDGAEALLRIKGDIPAAVYGNAAGANQPGINGDDGTTFQIDWAYVKVPIGPGTMTVGRQPADWGNKLLVWDNNRDRVKYTATFGQTTVGVLWDKFTEASNGANGVTDENIALRDKDGYAALAIQQIGDSKVGVIAIYAEDNRRSASGTGTVATVGVDSQKYYYLDGFWNVKAGPAMINGEAVMINNIGKKTDLGIFTDASVQAGPATVKGVAAYATGGFKADDDFIPLNMIGTDNPWAVMDFGGTVCTGPASTTCSTAYPKVAENKSQVLLGASAAIKPIDQLVIAVDGGYLWDTYQKNAWTASAAAVYLIGKNTTWTFLAGMWDGEKGHYNTGGVNGNNKDAVKVNNPYHGGDNYYVLGHKLEFTF